MSYQINFTDKNVPAISVNDSEVNHENDIAIFGRSEEDYGEALNANLFHILENFACHESSLSPGTPDLTKTSKLNNTNIPLLSNPTTGQMWWNKTQEAMYQWNGTEWKALSIRGDIGLAWGDIENGETIPLPVSSTGYAFERDECVWIVSPKLIEEEFEYIECFSDEDGVVTSQYENSSNIVLDMLASYMVVGIKGNVNVGNIVTALAWPMPTPTPTP